MGTLVRVLAVVLVALALLPRGVAHHDRVLVIGLEGGSLAHVERLGAEGALPELQRLLDHGVLTRVDGVAAADRRAFWATALAASPPSLAGEPPESYLWDLVVKTGAKAVVVNVPGTGSADRGRLTIRPGADDADGFVGDNIGATVRLDRLQKSNVGWPYATAAHKIAEWAHELSAGEASPWLGVNQVAPDDRHGVFRLYVLDEETAYLTPVYRRSIEPDGYVVGSDQELYIPDDPAWAVPAPRIRDYFARHGRDLAAARGAVATGLAAGDWRLMVYLETLLQPAHQIYTDAPGPDEGAEGRRASARSLREVYVDVDRRIGELVRASGPDAVVVVIGNEPSRDTQAGGDRTQDWILVAGARGEPATATSDIAQVAPTLRYLLGLSLDPHSDAQPIKAVRIRHWNQPWRSPTIVAEHRSSRELAFTPAAFEELGLLSESAHAPDDVQVANDGGTDASVDSTR